MRKNCINIILIFTVALMLSSCQKAAVSGTANQPAVPETASPSSLIEPSPSSEVQPTTEVGKIVSPNNAEREKTFRSFISDNYNKLSEACYGGIAGIGFIDLDMDGGIEMLMFDAGASASMGVQFFDIIDDSVECVSANMKSIGDVFGGDHFTDTYVNANFFEDFRLMQSKKDGEFFFLVSSGNGMEGSVYRELIQFGSSNGSLTLTSLMFKSEEYDPNSGTVLSTECRVNGASSTLDEYTAAYNKIYSEAEDTGLDMKGAFVWENQSFTQDKDGVLAMADTAITRSHDNLPE